MRNTGGPASEACMTSWAKDEEAEAWDIKGEEDNLQEDGKRTCLVNWGLPEHADFEGHREGVE